MNYFNRSELVGKYSWTATKEDDPRLRGEPDSSLFNRTEGYEVVYMINKIMGIRKTMSIADGRKIERMLAVHPTEYRSQQHVVSWVNAKWDSVK